MLPTVSWPANRPSYKTTHGSVTPRRASLRIVLTIAMYGPRLVWYSGVSGLVGSHGRSQSALRTSVSRRQAGPSGRDHDVVPRRDRLAQGRLDGGPVRDDHRPVGVAAGRTQQFGQDRPRLVGVDAGRRPVRHCDGQRPGHGRLQCPVVPPVFSLTMTSVITAAGSTALIMSTSASAPTVTAVSASISTPVRSAVRAVTRISTPSSATVRSTDTPCSPIG